MSCNENKYIVMQENRECEFVAIVSEDKTDNSIVSVSAIDGNIKNQDLKQAKVKENGVYKIVPDEGYNTMSAVEMDVKVTGSGSVNVIDNLDSTSDTDALSANMGRVLNEKVEASDILIQANIDAIAANVASIKANSDNITLLDTKVNANTEDIAAIDERVTANEQGIQDSQLKDLIVIVEEYPPASGRYRADATSNEIHNAVIQGRTALIQFDNLIYNFVEMDKSNVAKFRWIDVQSDKLGKRELNVGYDGSVEKVDLLYDGATKNDLLTKQDTLISGTNIKTINNESLLGSGNISLPVYDDTEIRDKLSLKPNEEIITNIQPTPENPYATKAQLELKQDKLKEGAGITISSDGTISATADTSDCVKVTEQVLDESQKTQARTNIGAVSQAEVEAAINAAVIKTINTPV